jgi:hypothetical protein
VNKADSSQVKYNGKGKEESTFYIFSYIIAPKKSSKFRVKSLTKPLIRKGQKSGSEVKGRVNGNGSEKAF